MHDLGAGDLTLSHRLIELGAERVIAVDRTSPLSYNGLKGLLPRIELPRLLLPRLSRDSRDCFRFLAGQLDHRTGSASIWVPHSHLSGVKHRRQYAEKLQCGCSSVKREVLAQVPNRNNTLIVYGPTRVVRTQVPEEFAALHLEKCWGFEELRRQHENTERSDVPPRAEALR